MRGRVLIIAGSDSSGGAGIQADIKTVTALGAYAATAITALTAQDTLGVHGILPVPPDFVRRQMAAVLSDIGADVVKIGMLGNATMVVEVANTLAALAPSLPIILDPVMISTSGARLLDADAIGILKKQLIDHVFVLTPNVPEAEMLLDRRIENHDAMVEAASALQALGPSIVVLKGGHLAGDVVRDVVCDHGEIYALEAPRIETRHTHGTGCTLASAISAGLAQGLAPRAAIERAHAYVQQAIRTAPGFGRGHGPLNHAIFANPE